MIRRNGMECARCDSNLNMMNGSDMMGGSSKALGG
jgi:hypothetical protein